MKAADLFCGAGGTSTGLFDAAEEKGLEVSMAAATSFPPEYEFVGPRDKVVWQIGNAVPVKTARSVVSTVL